MPHLKNLPELKIIPTDNVSLLSTIGKMSMKEVITRFGNHNKAYVAFYNGIPAAFGWVAMRRAKIGELNHEIMLPKNQHYLWNFRTLEDFRGLGIYPHLLQHILKIESKNADCFWIMHAPENEASQKGIVKAGFQFAGYVSVLKSNKVIFRSSTEVNYNSSDIPESLRFDQSIEEPATCWRCSSPHLAHKKTSCCCEPEGKACNEESFALS